MITDQILPVIAMLIASTAICAFSLRRTALNWLDPLVIINISVPLSAGLLASLCAAGLVDWSKARLFLLVQFTFFLAGRFAVRSHSLSEMRIAFNATVSSFRRNEVVTVAALALGVTAVLAALGAAAGASGDERQAFARALRPLILLQSGLFSLTLMAFLGREISSRLAWTLLLALIALSIPFSGKSVAFPLIYWVGLRLFLANRSPSLRLVLSFGLLALGAAAAMAIAAYGSGGLGGAAALVLNRLWLSGDGYIYAYQADALAQLRLSTSIPFIPYLLHPITSLFGFRAYEKPLGAMLASEFLGDDVLTGPNPQLPLLLDYFYGGSWVAIAFVSFALGMVTFGLRRLPASLAGLRGKYLRLGVAAIAYLSPSTGFLDFSQVLISAIGILIAAVTLTLFTALLPRQPAETGLANTA